jgi:hypothetical protein
VLAKPKKLVALVSIAYSICVSRGIYEHQKVQRIKTKKHVYKAKSFARKGIDAIREVFRREQVLPPYLLNRLLRMLRSILIKSAQYQSLKIVE